MYVVYLVVFVLGSGLYRKSPPEGNVLLNVCKCIGVRNLFHTTFWQTDSEIVMQIQLITILLISLPYAIGGEAKRKDQDGITGWTGLKRSIRYEYL